MNNYTTLIRMNAGIMRAFLKLVMIGWLVVVVGASLPVPAGADVNYIYDEMGRLRAVRDPGGSMAEYRYDAVGNITAIVRYTSGQLAIIEFTPNEGPVGTSVTIYGAGFASTPSGNTVKFNGKTATVTSASATKLVATVPSTAKTGTISVTVGQTTATSLESFLVSSSAVTAPPTITNFTPTIGAAGTAVTITGTNFDTTPNSTNVQLNQTVATATITSKTSISMTVPAFAAAGKIKVTTPLGIAVSAGDFIVPPGGVAVSAVASSTRLTVNGPAQPLAVNTQNKYGLVLFDGLPGDNLMVNLTNFSTVPANMLIAYAVYRPDNTLWAIGTVSTTNPSISLPKIQVAGTHVVSLASGTATFSMSLALKSNAVGVLVPDGAPTVVSATTPNAVRLYEFNASAGQQFGLAFTDVTHTPANTGYTSVSVYPPSGYAVGPCNAYSTVSGCGLTIAPVALSGTYTVVLTPPTGAAVGGTLTLSTDLQGNMAFNTPSTIQLLRAGQNASLTFTGAANQRVSLAVTGNTIPGTTNLYLKKPDGATLASTSISGATGFLDVQTLPTAGTYSLYVDPQGTSGGNMTITLYDVPPDVTGTIVSGGPPVTVTTTVSGQNVNLTFTGAANQRVSLAVSGSTIPGISGVYLKKPDGTTLASTNFSGATAVIDTQLPTAGTYSVFLDPQGTTVGSATLTLYDVSDITGTIVPDGPPVTVTTTAPSQNAILTFTGTANQRVNLTMSGNTIPSVTVSLNRPDGASIYYLSTPQATAYIEPQPLPTAGTYTIVIDPQGTSVGSATFTLKNLLPDITGTIMPEGPPVTVTTTAPGQNAVLTFTGAANQRVSLNISGNTIPGVNVQLKKPDGTGQGGIYTAGATGFMGAQTLQIAGTYSFFIDPQDTAVGSATLTLNDVAPDIIGTIVPDGPPVTITTTDPGQGATLTFTGAANQRVTLVMSDNTIPSIYVSLVKPDTFTLASMLIYGATGWMDVQTLPTAGTYSIRIASLGTGVGSATFTLHNAVPDITGAIVPGGPPVTATTTAPGQNANLTFTGAVNQRVSLAVSGSTIPGFYIVSLKKPDGTTLASTGVIGTGYLDVQTLPTSGTYSVFIDPQNTEVGGATVQLYDVPPDATGSLTIGGAAVPVTLSVPGQNGQLTFSGTAGQQVTVSITNNSISYVVGTILKPDGTVLTQLALFASPGNFPTQTLATTGIYTVVIDPQADRVGSLNVAATSP